MSRERRLGRGLEALLGRTNSPAEQQPAPGRQVDQDPQTSAGFFAQEPPAAETSWQVPAEDFAPVEPYVEPQPAPMSEWNTAPQPAAPQPLDPHAGPLSDHDNNRVHHLSVYEIDTNPFQPRTEFAAAEINELADSIRQHGVLQPVVVRPVDGRYQLISGERRWRAATQAGWSTVPAQIRYVEDREVAELTIVENLQRVDLGPLDKAASFQNYLEKFQCTQEELAKRLSIDRSTVANLIRLLELPESVQTLLRGGELTAGHARALLPLGDEREQMAFAERIKCESLSVRATEELVKETIRAADGESFQVVGDDGVDHAPAGAKPKGKQPPTRSAHIASLEQEFKKLLGAKVDIKQTAKGRGRIVLHFSSHDEFDRLRAMLTGGEPTAKRAAG